MSLFDVSALYIILPPRITAMLAVASRGCRTLPVRLAGSVHACFSLGQLQIQEDVDPAVMLHLQPYNRAPPCKSIKIQNNNTGDMISIADVKAFCQDGHNQASTKNGAVVSRTTTGGQGHHLHIELNPACVIEHVTVYKCCAACRLQMIDSDGRVFFDKAISQSAEQNIYIY